MSEVSELSQQLMGALVCNEYESALSLIEADPGLAEKPLDYSGRMAFHFLRSDIDVLRRFLALTVDPNQRDGDGRTALFGVGSVASAELLIAAGADVQARDNDGRTVIFGCIEDLLDLYLDAGLSINDTDASGRTPAHERIWSVAPLKALIDRGASLLIADDKGATPLHTCQPAAKLETPPEDLDWNVRDADGDTPLHYAVRAGQGYWIHKLREHGATDLPNNDGDLPMDLAVGQLVVGSRSPAPVSSAYLSAQLFNGKLGWDFESKGFGITEENGVVSDPGPFDVVDFRLYSENLHALSGRSFSDWSELFEEPVVVDAGPEKNAALYRHEHEPVDNSTMTATDFTPTSCQIEWSGQREHFADFHLQTKVEFLGIAVHPYSAFGQEANSSTDGFAEALRPHLPGFDDRYRIEPVNEHRARFRAFPK